MKKHKRIFGEVVTLVFSVIVALTLVACKHEHTFDEWQKISDKCKYERKCECGEVQTKAGAHNAGNDGKCIECHEKAATVGLVYELSEDGENYIISGYEGEDQNVIIPNFYNGKPVTSIGDSAFFNCDTLITNVTIPDSVESIGFAAFGGCLGLTEVIIPDSVTSIGDYAFAECIDLTRVTIGASVESIGYGAFDYCKKLIEVFNKSSLNIEAGSENYGDVGYYARNVYSSGTSKLSTDSNGYITYTDGSDIILLGYTGNQTELILPSNITEIIQYAFYDSDSLTSVTIGNSVESIGERAFYDCDSLESVTIGNSVESIGNYAFYNCDSLTRVTIGNSVESIGERAFYGCESLTSVTIGSSVESIGNRAFYECSSLERVYYFGTENEWSLIDKGSLNNPLTSATRYYYSESEPTDDGNYWHYDENGEIEIWN